MGEGEGKGKRVAGGRAKTISRTGRHRHRIAVGRGRGDTHMQAPQCWRKGGGGGGAPPTLVLVVAADGWVGTGSGGKDGVWRGGEGRAAPTHLLRDTDDVA